MTFAESIALFAIMVALAAMPSTSVALVVTRSVTAGLSNGIAAAVGIVLGDLLFVALAILGLSALAETMGSLFMVIRYLGATYLLWLGINLLTTKGTDRFTTNESAGKGGLATSLAAGLFITLGDIKAIFFYASR